MIAIPAFLYSALIVVLKILIALLAFGVIIFVHELGHFLAARLMGVKVNEFALGMGPKLFSFGKGETKYSLRAFPIGGFCSMEGEDEAGGGSVEKSDVDVDTGKLSKDPRAFCNKKVWRRMIIVVAGALMNIVLGFVLLVAYYGIFTQPAKKGESASFASTRVSVLDEKASSYQTGLRPGDTIQKIDGKRVLTDFDIASMMQSDADGAFQMTVKREVNGKMQSVTLDKVQFTLTTEKDGTRHLIYDFKVQPIKKTVASTIAQSGKMEYSVGVMVWRSLGEILTGKYGINDLSGPVGTIDAIGNAAVSTAKGTPLIDWANLLMITVLITVNVGIFNLLPIPALDGGRFVFLLIELIFRKPVPAKYEAIVHLVGFVLLLILIIIVTGFDIFRIFK